MNYAKTNVYAILENEFLPYEEAFNMMKVGFNQPCFGCYTEEYKTLLKVYCRFPINLPTRPFLAPTFRQAISWFRKRGYLIDTISQEIDNHRFHIRWKDDKHSKSLTSITYTTIEEMELGLVQKLIEIHLRTNAVYTY